MKNVDININDFENEHSEVIAREILKSIFNNVEHEIFIEENKSNVKAECIDFSLKFIPTLLNINEILQSQSLIEKNEKPIIIECPKTTRIDYHMSSKVYTNNICNISNNIDMKKSESPHKDSLYYNSMQHLNLNSKIKEIARIKDNFIFFNRRRKQFE